MTFLKKIVAVFTRNDTQRAGAKMQIPDRHGIESRIVAERERMRREVEREQEHELEKVREFDREHQK